MPEQTLCAKARQILIAYIPILEYTTFIVKTPLRSFKAQFFQALAHPTRIAIVERLRGGELTAGTLQTSLQIEQANLSQHLAVLRAKQLVVSRKSGNQVYYALRDPILIEVLNLVKQYCLSHLNDTVAMLDEIDTDENQRV